MSFFYNAVSFISNLFFTKKEEESHFDELYLSEDNPIGNLGPLVPVVPVVPEVLGAPLEQVLVVVPVPLSDEEPSGIVLIEEPEPTVQPTVQPEPIDLLKLHQDGVPVEETTIPGSDGSKIIFANATAEEYNKLLTIGSQKLRSSIKSQITKGKNAYYKSISKIEFCVELLDEDESIPYDYTFEVPDMMYEDNTKIILGFINLGMYKGVVGQHFIKYGGTGNNLIPVTVKDNKINTINGDFDKVNMNNYVIEPLSDKVPGLTIPEKIVHALIALNKCINEEKNFNTIDDATVKELFFEQESVDINNIKSQKPHKTNAYQDYFTTNMKKSNKEYISQSVSLVMTYEKLYTHPFNETLADYNNLDNYTISFSYVITTSKSPRKILLTQPMVEAIVPKLNNTNNCIKDLFIGLQPIVSDTSRLFYLVKSKSNSTSEIIQNDDTTLQIYTPDNLISIDWTVFTNKLNNLQNKPHTLLTHDSLNTYLNILIAMLDKPHDIIGGRVPKEVQRFMMSIISKNIEQYINYLDAITADTTNVITKINGADIIDGKIKKFRDFITFVRLMIPNFKQFKPSKNAKTDVIYENAIMLFVHDILKEGTVGGANILSTELNTNFPNVPPNNDNIVINPDIMYITSEITSRVNQENLTIRKYFSAPEVIDHGHVYNIDNNTNIQFPENYKQIQLSDIATTNYFTIHSYSETTKVGTANILHYNVYVWFTVNNDITPKCIIKYKTPFMNAPECARVYSGYNNLNDKDIFNIFNDNKASFGPLSEAMQTLIPYLMLDQFYNAKSLQDDQNQLQVNQISTINAIPDDTTATSVPTKFLGLCCDLTSAANGFNYYMSKAQELRNSQSIVGYYHSAKRIWITNRNQIKFQIINPSAKSASKNIFEILQTWINDATNPVHAGGAGDDVPDPKRRRTNNENSNKRTLEYSTEDRTLKIQKIENTNKKKEAANEITLSYFCDEEDWICDDSKIEEYGQYVYYNTMADWLYVDNNFDTYKNSLLTQVLYDVNGTKYLSSNYVFEIFSNDFVDKMIKMLEIYSTQTNIQQQDVNKIIGQCAIYILTKFELKPDNIVPPNEQIKISNDLDNKYFEITQNLQQSIQQSLIPDDVAKGLQIAPDTPRGVADFYSQDQNGGFSKKRTNKKRTIRKRTIRKRTNKKRTIRKKIKRTIYKTKKTR